MKSSIDQLLSSIKTRLTSAKRTVPGFAPRQGDAVWYMQRALRCTVVLPCGHGFCSLYAYIFVKQMKHPASDTSTQCIRKELAGTPHCPNCRKIAVEEDLRLNSALEDVVVAWKLAR